VHPRERNQSTFFCGDERNCSGAAVSNTIAINILVNAGRISKAIVNAEYLMTKETTTSHAEVLPAYRRLRQIGIQLNHKLVKLLSTPTLNLGAMKLGILKNGTFVFESEDETSVLMDFCIHNIQVDGLTAVQRYLEQSPPPSDSDEMVLLTAMLSGFYSLIQVVEAEYSVGVTVHDVLRGDTYFVADIGIGSTAEAGALFATRLFCLKDYGFHVTGGAGLPVDGPTLAKISKELDREFAPGTDFADLTPTEESDLAALVIRVCRASGMSSYIGYGASAEGSSRKEKPIDPREVWRANPNDPCPSGSGRKFKTCCGRRPRR
jgi:hypothetical protein